MLPLAEKRSESVNTSIHPMQQEPYAESLKAFIAHLESYLKDGAGKKAWRDEASQATQQHMDGKLEEAKEADREAHWGAAAKTDGN